MADLYDLASGGEQVSAVSLGPYLETVCRSALPPRHSCPVELDIDPEARAPMKRALLSGLLVAELVSAAIPESGQAGAEPVGLRLSVRAVANGTRVGVEIQNAAAAFCAHASHSSLGLLGILEEDLGAAVSVDLESRRIALSFLMTAEIEG
jgi:hypothetical protein